MAILRNISGEHHKYFVLGSYTLLGRSAESPLARILSSKHIDRLHASIRKDQGAYVLEDSSRHGTLVNGIRVEHPTPLVSGDHIRIGEVELDFLDDAEAEAFRRELEWTTRSHHCVAYDDLLQEKRLTPLPADLNVLELVEILKTKRVLANFKYAHEICDELLYRPDSDKGYELQRSFYRAVVFDFGRGTYDSTKLERILTQFLHDLAFHFHTPIAADLPPRDAMVKLLSVAPPSLFCFKNCQSIPPSQRDIFADICQERHAVILAEQTKGEEAYFCGKPGER